MDWKLIDALFACRYYSAVTGFDQALLTFQQATSPCLNLTLDNHRMALLQWLNGWGCRHIASKFHRRASAAIRDWWKEHKSCLPPQGANLAALTSCQIASVGLAYEDLKCQEIGRLKVKHRRDPVRIPMGDTAAAKTLFAVRPNSLLPWDAPIREELNGQSYNAYLETCRGTAQALMEEAKRRVEDPNRIPELVGRPNSSLAKIVDECNWVYMTKGYAKITCRELRRIHAWSKEV